MELIPQAICIAYILIGVVMVARHGFAIAERIVEMRRRRKIEEGKP